MFICVFSYPIGLTSVKKKLEPKTKRNYQAQKIRQKVQNTSVIRQRKSDEVVVTRLAKTHEDYWKSRVRRRVYRGADGVLREVPTWQVSLGHAGQHRWINLDTANKDDAAKKARALWLKLKTQGWDAVKPDRERIVDATVGEFLDTVRAEADLLPATFEIYAKKFRRLVAGVARIDGGRAKHDHHGTGYQDWLARISAVKLSRLTPEAIQRWKTRHITAAGTNPLKERRARRTVASVLRSSKALFAEKIVSKLRMDLPDPLPLAGVDIPRAAPAQYVSKIESMLLFQQAERELLNPTDDMLRASAEAALRKVDSAKKAKRQRASKDGKEMRGWTARPELREKWITEGIERARRHRPEMFKAFCLALFAGLRRDEIDTLTWKQIDFTNHTIRIETNEFTRAKSERSEAAVDIDPAFTERLRQWMQESESKFVISVDRDPKTDVSSYHHYRCDCMFKRLTAWLQAHGVEDRNALHTLRKEFGTQINRSHGLFAASAALRHASIQLTRAVYVAKKDRAVFTMPASAGSPQASLAAPSILAQ